VSFIEQALKAAGLSDARVIPFGSHALGTATPDSDVDIAIVSASFRGKDVFERALLTKDAEVGAMRKFALPFDIVALSPEEYEGETMTASFIKASAGHPT
jgi:predicted nucleotidyltransferase